MFKWLTITIIVLTGFLVVLLSLGYLLKENEVATTALKNKIASKALIKQQKQQQRKYQRKQQFLDKNLSAKQKSQQQIIASHLSCQTSKQCLVVDTQSKALGCSVAINTLGAAILLKGSGQKGFKTVSVWAKVNSFNTTWQTLWEQGNIQIGIANSQPAIWYSNANPTSYRAQNMDNEWHFYTFTLN